MLNRDGDAQTTTSADELKSSVAPIFSKTQAELVQLMEEMCKKFEADLAESPVSKWITLPYNAKLKKVNRTLYQAAVAWADKIFQPSLPEVEEPEGVLSRVCQEELITNIRDVIYFRSVIEFYKKCCIIYSKINNLDQAVSGDFSPSDQKENNFSFDELFSEFTISDDLFLKNKQESQALQEAIHAFNEAAKKELKAGERKEPFTIEQLLLFEKTLAKSEGLLQKRYDNHKKNYEGLMWKRVNLDNFYEKDPHKRQQFLNQMIAEDEKIIRLKSDRKLVEKNHTLLKKKVTVLNDKLGLYEGFYSILTFGLEEKGKNVPLSDEEVRVLAGKHCTHLAEVVENKQTRKEKIDYLSNQVMVLTENDLKSQPGRENNLKDLKKNIKELPQEISHLVDKIKVLSKEVRILAAKFKDFYGYVIHKLNEKSQELIKERQEISEQIGKRDVELSKVDSLIESESQSKCDHYDTELRSKYKIQCQVLDEICEELSCEFVKIPPIGARALMDPEWRVWLQSKWVRYKEQIGILQGDKRPVGQRLQEAISLRDEMENFFSDSLFSSLPVFRKPHVLSLRKQVVSDNERSEYVGWLEALISFLKDSNQEVNVSTATILAATHSSSSSSIESKGDSFIPTRVVTTEPMPFQTESSPSDLESKVSYGRLPKGPPHSLAPLERAASSSSLPQGFSLNSIVEHAAQKEWSDLPEFSKERTLTSQATMMTRKEMMILGACMVVVAAIFVILTLTTGFLGFGLLAGGAIAVSSSIGCGAGAGVFMAFRFLPRMFCKKYSLSKYKSAAASHVPDSLLLTGVIKDSSTNHVLGKRPKADSRRGGSSFKSFIVRNFTARGCSRANSSFESFLGRSTCRPFDGPTEDKPALSPPSHLAKHNNP